MAMPSSQLIDPSQLDLSSEELSLLRQGQSALAHGGANSTSSRGASRASSQGLLLDPHSLASLEVYFERVLSHIEHQLQYLTERTSIATQNVYDETGQMIVDADAEIARFTKINEQIDELETEFDKIGNIYTIVRDIRQRLEEAERELDRDTGSSSRHHGSRRERHHESHHGRHREGHRSGHSSHRHRH